MKSTTKNRSASSIRAFTLIELMVVILILAILAALIIPNVVGKADDAKRGQAVSNIGELEKALEAYRLDNNRYPTSEQGGLRALRENPGDAPNWQRPYIQKDIPPDPWGAEYIYESDGRSYQIISLGADGAEEGEGNDADIVVQGGDAPE